MISEVEYVPIGLLFGAVLLGLVWTVFNTLSVLCITVKSNVTSSLLDADNGSDASDKKMDSIESLKDIGGKISRGANAFLFQEYKVMLIFVVLFSGVVFLLVDYFGQTGDKVIRFYGTIAYIVGSLTSILCGYIGMRIAVAANFRTTYKAIYSLEGAFNCAYQAGCVMGFSTTALSIGSLTTLMVVYIQIFNPGLDESAFKEERTYQVLMELIAGFGLGGSSMALFGRVGGGIYTKAADVGADLVGKVEHDLQEDSPRNPATIADNVGDNVGDIAGMGSDLFGSFAESTCASLVLISGEIDLLNQNINGIYYPLLISATGIVACLLTSIFGIYVFRVTVISKIEKALNLQLVISTVLMALFLVPTSYYFLPTEWEMNEFKQAPGTPDDRLVKANWVHCFLCAGVGLLSGFFIGISTDFYTSAAHGPVQEMAQICTSGAAINIIYGLALGYLSTVIPVCLLSVTIILSVYFLGMLGVALAAIGMLSTLAVSLAIDAYGPISDNAGGIAEMSEIGGSVRIKTDALDAAGNTTAAVGKGFAIGSAALVSLALYGAYLTRCKSGTKNTFHEVLVDDGWVFGSMLVGSMLPFAFSAMTMKSVGLAANEMVEEVRRQFLDVE